MGNRIASSVALALASGGASVCFIAIALVVGTAEPVAALDCGFEGGTACLVGSDFDLYNGNGVCDRGLIEEAGVCVNSSRRSAEPAFPNPRLENPFGLNDIGGLSAPALADLDDDGDLDLMAGKDTGCFIYFENVGTTTSPSFGPRLSAPHRRWRIALGRESETPQCLAGR